MILINKVIFIVFFYLSCSMLAIAENSINIVMKINDSILTNYDIEKEINILVALNNQLQQIEKDKLKLIAKNSLVKQIIRKQEINKLYKLKDDDFNSDALINNLILNLNFSNKNDFIEYLGRYKVSIDEIIEKIEIENQWKGLIYNKYIDKINIDKDQINKKLISLKSKSFQNEYNLSEILFEKKNNKSINELYKIIKQSIFDIGFENTANFYSISDSSNKSGKIGWIKDTSLSKNILKKLKSLKKNEFTEPIQLGNNYLILKINDIKKVSVQIDETKELDKMILIETTNQLNKFSNIYFNKIKLNTIITSDF
jgi:peptidyl-prolyl cis-trans isomerase SurA